jgi:hypothetical protein
MRPSKDHYAAPAPRDTVAAIQQDLTRRIQDLRAQLKVLFKSLPEASSDVRLLPGAARCGVVSSSAIHRNGGILSPSYYLNSDAIGHLEHLIDTTDVMALDKKIQEILKTGKIKLGAGVSTYTQPLNPEFLEALRIAWEGDTHVRHAQ